MSERLSSEKATAEDELSELFLRFSTRDNEIKGFVGQWTFYKPDSAEDNAITDTFRCLRTYEVLERDDESAPGEKPGIRFKTFHETAPANKQARRRSIDGVYESSHLRLTTDLFFSNNTALSDVEKDEHMPDCVFWRSVALDKESVMRMAPRLPPRPDTIEAEGLYPNWSPAVNPLSVFAFESFIMFGDDRWSMGALYSVHTLQLLSHFYIQETLTSVDPAKPIKFENFSFREAEGSMSSDTLSWLDNGNYKGEMCEIVWDEDGEALKLPTRPANWNPPSPSSETHRLFMYRDRAYAYYPLQLPVVTQAERGNHFGEGARFEMGVYSSKYETLSRLILRYSASGQAVSLTKEIFKSEGSFDFDRRQSHSVRRSLQARRGANSRLQIFQADQRTAKDRAAKLDQAFTAADAPTETDPKAQQDTSGRDARNVMDKAALSRVMENSLRRAPSH